MQSAFADFDQLELSDDYRIAIAQRRELRGRKQIVAAEQQHVRTRVAAALRAFDARP